MSTQTDNPTVTHDDLHTQYTRLAWLLKQAESAEQESKWANHDYDTAFEPVYEKFRAEHPELVASLDAARSRKAAAQEKVAAAREALKGSLALYWIDNRSDEKPLEGLAKKDSVNYIVRPGQDALLHMQLREYAPFLLKVDEKALERFVKDNAVVDEQGRASLPSPMANYLNALTPVVQREATISDKTVVKFAPDFDPDAITEVEIDALEHAAVDEQDATYQATLAAAVVEKWQLEEAAKLRAEFGDIPF